jgi:hypothetical protein
MILYSMGGHEFADGTEQTGVFVVCEIPEFRGIGAMLGNQVEIVPSGEVERMRAQLDATLKDRAMIIAERDRTFALMLDRAEKADAELKAMKADRIACQIDYCALMDRLDAATSLQKPQTTPGTDETT